MQAETTTTATSAAASHRQSHTVACLPIVYGSIAFYLGKRADDYQTHEWSLYLRGPNHEDLSPAISKVVFQLHPSFAQPTRELTSPPYEVTERGWGEFEAQIHIHWKDTTEKTTIVNHTIKLYPPGTPVNSLPTDTETPVLAETYDEVVFTDPSESFMKSLTQVPLMPKLESNKDDDEEDEEEGGDKKNRASSDSKQQQQQKSSAEQNWKDHLNIVYSDQQEFLTLISAQKFLQDELSKVKQRFQIVNDDILGVDQKLIVAQQQKHREAAAAAVAGSAAAAHTTTTKSTGPTAATTTTTGGKKTKAPSGQRKSRPASQTKKAKTIASSTSSTPVPTSAEVGAAAVAPTAAGSKGQQTSASTKGGTGKTTSTKK